VRNPHEEPSDRSAASHKFQDKACYTVLWRVGSIDVLYAERAIYFIHETILLRRRCYLLDSVHFVTRDSILQVF
jgi:hypothetical protein